jgi:uncharacterized repeat protein (TIGR01451 family)
MRQRTSGTGCIPQILAIVAILACLVVALLAFGVFRLQPFRSGAVQIEAAASPSTAKAGDVVTYTVTMYNVDVRDGLKILTVTGSLLGDLSGAFVSSLAEDTSDRGVFTRTVQLSDVDPLTNTFAVYAQGADQVYSDTAVVTVDLLKPTIQVDTTVAPATAARGETVTYTIAVANMSDIPVEVITVTDSLLGDLSGSFSPTLAPGMSEAENFEWTVPLDEADPLERTVTVYATGLGQVVNDSATAQIALLRPAVQVEAAVSPAAAAPGQVVSYTVAVSNVGQVDLEALRVTDSELGDLSSSFPRELPAGAAERRSFAWTVPSDAGGSLSRRVTVEAAGAGEEVSDTVSADLVLAGLQVRATGTSWARAGEAVTYTVTITNTSSGATPDLILERASDTQGELTSELPDACRTLASGEACTFSYKAAVPSGENALTNVIEVRYRPQGFDNAVVGVAQHTVDVFQVSVAVEQSGPALSQMGERASYFVRVTNTSSPAAPDLVFDRATDTLGEELRVPGACARLVSGEACSFSYEAVVPSGEDPVTISVEVRYRPEGFSDVVSATGSYSVELFQPSVALAVTGDPLSQAGEAATHRVTITNTSSSDAVDLILDGAAASRGDELTVPSACRVLAAGEVCTFSYELVVPADEDPVTTRVEVRYHPEGFANVVSAAASHTVEIFQPSIAVQKTGPAEAIEGEEVTYTVEVANTSSDDAPDLILDAVTDSLNGDLTRGGEGFTATCPERLASGERCEIIYAYTPDAADPRPLVNTVRVESHPVGFTDLVAASAEHSLVFTTPWQRGVGLPAGAEVRALAVCRADPDVLYAGFGSGGDGVYRSEDGGGNWVGTVLEEEDAEVFDLAVDPDDCDTVYAGAWRGGVRRSTNGGRTWAVFSDGLEGAFVYSVVVDPTDGDVLYAGTAEQGVYRSGDAGATWRAWGLDGLTVPHLSVASDGRAVYAATWGDGVHRWTRDRADWSAVNSGIRGAHANVYAVAVDPGDASTVFAATASGGVYRTLDGGGTWEQVLPSPATAYAVAVEPGPGAVVYAGTAEGVFRSEADGDSGSWEPFNAGLEGLAVRSLALASEGPLHLGSSDGAWRHPR